MNAIGVMLNNLEPDRHRAWKIAAEAGFQVVHTSALPEKWLPSGQLLDDYLTAAQASGLIVHSMFIGFDGQNYADRASAARTVGLAVSAVRAERLRVARHYVPAAKHLNAEALAMHVGHLPESDPADYADLVSTMGDLADRCRSGGLGLHLETGMESAAVLRQFIADIGRPNVRVNFDPANFLHYGTDDPMAALELLGPLIGGVHCKDALPPTEPGRMGTDVPLGQGRVDFRRMVAQLRAFDYRGPLILERERGPNVRADLDHGRSYLQTILRDLYNR
jgi:sugar phosphate isomerase/epimerase